MTPTHLPLDNPRIEKKVRIPLKTLRSIDKLILKKLYKYFDQFVNEAIKEKLERLHDAKK